MRNLVHSIDPFAYIAINEVADIFPATNLDDRIPEKTDIDKKRGHQNLTSSFCVSKG